MIKASQQISVMNWRRGHPWNGLIRFFFVLKRLMLNVLHAQQGGIKWTINMSKFIKSLKHFIIWSFLCDCKSNSSFQPIVTWPQTAIISFLHWSKAQMQQRKQKSEMLNQQIIWIKWFHQEFVQSGGTKCTHHRKCIEYVREQRRARSNNFPRFWECFAKWKFTCSLRLLKANRRLEINFDK